MQTMLHVDKYNVKVLADSISPHGVRLTTVEATFPRLILSEVNTHRMFSRNSASTRAIPLYNQVYNVMTDPFIPERFGRNKPGMQHSEVLTGEEDARARINWLRNRDRAVTGLLELVLGEEVMSRTFRYEPGREYVPGKHLIDSLGELKQIIPKSNQSERAAEMNMLNVHKQLAGRTVETFMWHTAILTATEFDNFFALRDHPEAQGEIARVARMIKAAMSASEPMFVGEGEWHLPLVDVNQHSSLEEAIKSSVARVAATSYNRHNQIHQIGDSEDALRELVSREIRRYEGLRSAGHMSPFEHQATPFMSIEWEYRRQLQNYADYLGQKMMIQDYHRKDVFDSLDRMGNFRGWTQERKLIPNEDNFAKVVQ